ncbi:MAG TPA: hypothetical protein VNA24_20495 [Hyalangium sp.]|nr:hypothetical protein [Hyalangium sp.]
MRAVQLLPFFLLVSVISCSTVQTQQDPSAPPRPKTSVEVRNQKPVDFNMYVVDGTRRIRLGLVPGMSSRTFTIPAHMVNDRGSLRFQADTIGSDTVLASDEELAVHEGDTVSLTIQ